MSLFFLHPIYLFGLIAAALPVLIHLLNRRRLKRLRFPAVRFILLSQRRIARSYRLRHWLLLALRTCAVLLLVLLLAHPIFQSGAGLMAAAGPASLALVLDNSLSMTWADGGGGFKRAKEAARAILAALKDGDGAALIAAAAPPGRPPPLIENREALLRELETLEISDGSADFSHALRRAYEAVKEPAAQKEIWILTDLAATGWNDFSLSSLGQYDPLIPVKIVKVGAEEPPWNAAIKEIDIRGRGPAVGLPIHLDATIVNFGDREIKDLLVQLQLDGRSREQRLVSLGPKREQVVSFQTKLSESGEHHGTIVLKKEELAGNAVSHFTLKLQDKIKVLLVDGDPQTSLIQGETFFLARALDPSGESDASLFLPTIVVPEGLAAAPLEAHQVLVLCNVASLPEALYAKIARYVREGGGLLLFLGDRVQPDHYNSSLFHSSHALLPGRLIERRTIPHPGGEKIGKIESGHPALRGLSDELLKTSLQSVRVGGYFRAEPDGGVALLSLANGDPLLMEKKIGAGRVLLFTTAADHDWSDLPLKTAYLPLVQALANYLTAEKRGEMDAGIVVGAQKRFTLPPALVGKSLKIAKPDRKEREIPIVADRDKAVALFEDNDRAGIYRLSLSGGSLRQAGVAEMYAVNPPFLESRLAATDEASLRRSFNPVRPEVITLEDLAQGGTRVDLSVPVLVFLMVVLAAEGWLAQRF